MNDNFTRPTMRSKVYVSNTETFPTIIYMHILHSNIRQTSMFQSIIPNSDM